MEKRYKQEIQALGGKIKALRKKQGLSQLDLELLSGINRAEISRIENGLKNVEFITLVRIAIALEIEIGELFKK